MSDFKVMCDGAVILETDNWVEAQSAALTPWPLGVRAMHVVGTHPTHSWTPPGPDRRCTSCGAWDNGSYGSQSPCGYDWSRDSLVSALEREQRLITGSMEPMIQSLRQPSPERWRARTVDGVRVQIGSRGTVLRDRGIRNLGVAKRATKLAGNPNEWLSRPPRGEVRYHRTQTDAIRRLLTGEST